MRSIMDTQFEALANVHRRRLLVSLTEHNPQAAQPVASNASITTDDERRKIQMHHVHLPKLEAYGYITWDRETNQVVKGPAFDEIEPLLTVLIENQDQLSSFAVHN